MTTEFLSAVRSPRARGLLAGALLGSAATAMAEGVTRSSTLSPDIGPQISTAMSTSSDHTQAWSPVTIVEAGSSSARDLAGMRRLQVQLPDDSKAQLAVTESGEPRALMLSESNTIADVRSRALEAGAALNGDGSVTLPVSTAAGSRIDFVIRTDGSVVAPALPLVRESARR